MAALSMRTTAAETVLWDGLEDLITSSAPPASLVSATSSTMPVFSGAPISVEMYSSTLPVAGVSSYSTVSSSNGSSPTTTSAGAVTPYLDFMPPPRPSSDLPSNDQKRKRDRERNTEAARRYRKRRVDETDELRAALTAMTKERDELRLKLVRAEAEASLLRKLHIASSSSTKTEL